MRKLSKIEVSLINKLKTVNQRKDFVQNLVINEWLKKPQGVFLGFTSIGKTYSVAKIITILNRSVGKTTCIIVPTTDLYKDFIEAIALHKLKNVDVFVVNTLANKIKNGEQLYYDLVVCEELHVLCGNSIYFSEILPNIKFTYFWGSSATLEKEHIEYLSKHNLEIFFNIPLEDGVKISVIPDFTIWNLRVELTPEEQKQYIAAQERYYKYIREFSVAYPNNPTSALNACLGDKTKKIKFDGVVDYSKNHAIRIGEQLGMNGGQTVGEALKWRVEMQTRNRILTNSRNSLIKTIELINYINEPAIIVLSSIAVIDKLIQYIPDAAPYHSKITPKKKLEYMNDFKSGKLKYLLVVKALKMGLNVPHLRFIVRQFFTSKVLDVVQWGGRALRFDILNPKKTSHLIHIYVGNFIDNQGVEHKSQMQTWLSNALRNRSFCEYVDDIKEIKI